jgi:16S rRNA G1207 methylase RsmC
MREQLKQGVQVVSAPQLFPTPPKLAARLVELADIGRGMTVLEPSAGTGNIMQAIMNDDKAGAVVAVEINQRLADRLREEYALSTVHCCDFLQFSRGNWPVDRIVMNPPFANGDDIKHIKHAASMLKPGGRLVAICAGGPRQREALSCLGTWEDLPLDSFKSSGTSVNAAIVVIQS